MNDARVKVIKALNLARVGDAERATRFLRELRKQGGCEADAYYGLGLLELCQNNIERSEAEFRKAISIEPAHADAYYQLAKIADSKGDAKIAKHYLESAIAQNPGHVMAMEALAEHCADQVRLPQWP